MKKALQVTLVVVGILILDQALKIWIKTNFTYGEDRPLFGLGLPWARLEFVENPGMAFGMTFGGDYGKLALSLFRIVAIVLIIGYIRRLAKADAPLGLLLSFGAILAGAAGNMIDCAFYGLLFSPSDPMTGDIATLFPPEGGYASFLHGKVVDMIYFPFGRFPEWLPLLGGRIFFEPVFNLADAAITTGVLNLLIFQRRYFSNDNTPTIAASESQE